MKKYGEEPSFEEAVSEFALACAKLGLSMPEIRMNKEDIKKVSLTFAIVYDPRFHYELLTKGDNLIRTVYTHAGRVEIKEK